MSKKLLLVPLILISVQAFAQREVYFNASKPEDLKVESLKGLELQIGFNPFKILSSNNYYNPTFYYADFFSERKITPTMTLTYSAGIFGSIVKSPVFTYDSISGGSYWYGDNSNYEKIYSLGLKVGLEPRWYWTFKKRSELNKARLNSGWFLSLPFDYSYSIYNSYKSTPVYNSQSYGGLNLKPTIGYRQSITNNIFLEGSFGYGITYGLSTYNNKFYGLLSSSLPELKLKAAYTFK